MERGAKFLGLLLGIALLSSIQLQKTQASRRRLTYPDPLPSCSQVPQGTAGWDCHDDAADRDLPPCDFHHQNIGVDCLGWSPINHAGSPRHFQSKTRPLLERHVATELQACRMVPGGVSGVDCYDPLPLCDNVRNIIGVDCSGWPTNSPPIPVARGEVKASATTMTASVTQKESGGHEQEDLPVHPLPLCDLWRHRNGIDCWVYPAIAPPTAP